MKKNKKPFAKKSLGQNFLNSAEIRDKIVEAAGPIKEKNILEIGPGLGFLTSKLIATGAHVTAVELDERALEILKKDFHQKKNFTLIHGDILQQNFDTLFEQKKYSIVANIPYNITSFLLRKILSLTKNKPEQAVLMVQKEVAQKITETKKKSILSLSVEIFATSEILFLVPRENFTPVPQVDSAIIKLVVRDEPLVEASMEKDFFTVVNAGFSQKRKKLGNVFASFFGIPKAKLLGDIDGNRRAETLSVEEWKSITKNFQKMIKNE